MINKKLKKYIDNKIMIKYKDYLEKMNKLFTDKNEFIKAELDLISNNAELKDLFDTKE